MLAIGAAVALLASAIPYSLELEALRRLPTGVFGVLMSMEPAVAALSGLILLGEVLHAREWVAIALVVAASAGATGFAQRGARCRGTEAPQRFFLALGLDLAFVLALLLAPAARDLALGDLAAPERA